MKISNLPLSDRSIFVSGILHMATVWRKPECVYQAVDKAMRKWGEPWSIRPQNVTGTLNPIAEIGNLCRKHGIIFLVDAAQTAGIIPVDVQNMKIGLLAFPGHKGLLGPQGVGRLEKIQGSHRWDGRPWHRNSQQPVPGRRGIYASGRPGLRGNKQPSEAVVCDVNSGNIEKLIEGVDLVLDGRAIIKNVRDENVAKSVYSEYIGL